jgi:tetratricopeptide (TPR) repeat protein
MNTSFTSVATVALCTVLYCGSVLGQTTHTSSPGQEMFDWDHEIAVADDAFNDGNYVEAEQDYRRSLAIARQLHLGEKETATSLASVAQSLRYEKKYAEAEPLFRQALAIRERVLPPNHPRTTNTIEGLGVALAGQNRLDEAETYYLRALAIWDRTPEDNPCRHGSVLDELGKLYFRQGKYEKAEPMYQRALTLWEQAKEKCGVIVPVMNDLAFLYQAQGSLDKAEAMYQRTIPMLQKELDDEQPELVAIQRAQLARVYLAEKKFAEAAPLLEQAVSVLEKSGPSQRETLLRTLAIYRIVLQELHQDADEARIQAQIDAINGTKVRSVDPLLRWQGLMSLVNQTRLPEQMTPLLLEALREVEKLPPGTELAETLSRLGILSVGTHNDQAEQYYARALSIYENVLGKDSNEVAHTLENLANVYELEQKSGQAEAARIRCVAIREKMPGQELAYALSLDHLGYAYFQLRRFPDAEPPYLRALQVMEVKKGQDSREASYEVEHLGMLYLAWDKNEDAVRCYSRLLKLDETQFGASSPKLLPRLQILADLMRKMNRLVDAQEFETRHKDIIDQQIAINRK